MFDAKVPGGAGKFFVTVFDRYDARTSSASLVDTSTGCAGSVFPHPLKDPDAEILPVEPIGQDAFAAPAESLAVGHGAAAEEPIAEPAVEECDFWCWLSSMFGLA